MRHPERGAFSCKRVEGIHCQLPLGELTPFLGPFSEGGVDGGCSGAFSIKFTLVISVTIFLGVPPPSTSEGEIIGNRLPTPRRHCQWAKQPIRGC